MKKCKITVLKREFYPDLAREYIPFPDFGPCDMMKEGDVFVTSGHFGNEMPRGFCAMAWQAICLQATTLAGGGWFLATTTLTLPTATMACAR